MGPIDTQYYLGDQEQETKYPKDRVKPNTTGLKKLTIKLPLMIICYSLDQCLIQPSLENLPHTADRNKNKIHSHTLFRDNFEHTAINGMTPSNLPQSSENHQVRGW